MQSSEQIDSRRTFLAQLSAICAWCGLPLPFQGAYAREYQEGEPGIVARATPCAGCVTCQARFCRYR